MEKEKIKEFSEKYFGGMKTKHFKEFEETTPKGNIIKGLIAKKANRFLGSMLITEVYFKEKDITVEKEQFIQAMPKINYYDFHNEFYQGTDSVYNAYEKLDGSCLILYGLYLDGEVMEIVPKTRGIPVADKHIKSMYNEIDHSNIESIFAQNLKDNPVLLFELFGALNQHSIFYPKVRIDINLIGASFGGEFFDWYQLEYLSKQFDFDMPKTLFKLMFSDGFWKIIPTPGMYLYYLVMDLSKEEVEALLTSKYPTKKDAIDGLKAMITTINNNHSKVHNRQLLEGVVLDVYRPDEETFAYIKIKSADIEEKCRTENGVPRRFILKEVYKYFDEYGSKVKEIYLEDKNHYFDYVMKNLSEEFDEAALEQKKTKYRIENVFLDVLESKEPPKGLQELCQSIKEDYPDESVSDLMRIFAQRYPEKKRHASMAFSIFSKIT